MDLAFVKSEAIANNAASTYGLKQPALTMTCEEERQKERKGSGTRDPNKTPAISGFLLHDMTSISHLKHPEGRLIMVPFLLPCPYRAPRHAQAMRWPPVHWVRQCFARRERHQTQDTRAYTHGLWPSLGPTLWDPRGAQSHPSHTETQDYSSSRNQDYPCRQMSNHIAAALRLSAQLRCAGELSETFLVVSVWH